MKTTDEIIAEVRDEWMARGLCTDPADRAKAEEGVMLAYRAADVPVPERFEWYGSPEAGAKAVAEMLGSQTSPPLCMAMHVVRDRAVDTLWSTLKHYALIDREVFIRARRDVQEPISEAISPLVWLVGGEIWQSGTYLHRPAYGCHDSAWVSFYDILARLDPKCASAVGASGIAQTARHCGWWWPLETVAVMSERPSAVRRDAQGRPHGESAPAVAYRDGFAVYAWHGTGVPEDLIKGKWGVREIWDERNTEIRRCAIEKMGWDRFIKEAKLRRIGKPVPDPGNDGCELVLYDAPAVFEEPVRVLLCTNGSPERDGTRRRFGLTVPAECEDPVSAAAWTFGIPVKEYRRLEVRR